MIDMLALAMAAHNARITSFADVMLPAPGTQTYATMVAHARILEPADVRPDCDHTSAFLASTQWIGWFARYCPTCGQVGPAERL